MRKWCYSYSKFINMAYCYNNAAIYVHSSCGIEGLEIFSNILLY